MTVIKTDEKLEIGKVYGTYPFESMTDNNGDAVPCPAFRVVKEATRQEYLAEVAEFGWSESNLLPEWMDCKNFYWVLMD